MKPLRSAYGGLLLLILLTTAGTAARGQTDDSDTLRARTEETPAPDSVMTTDSSAIGVDSLKQYPDFWDDEPFSLDDFTGAARLIDLSGSNRRMYYSLCDALVSLTPFYTLHFGPFGQSYGVTFLGLSPYLYSVSPDHAGSYQLYSFPPSGLNDLRLFSLEQSGLVLVELDSPLSPAASIRAYSIPPDEKDAQTEISAFKGGYSFANTDVRFNQRVTDRFAWNFNIGIEQSDGYLPDPSRKERENYGLGLHYMLTSQWQLSSRMRLMRADDQMAQIGRLSGITATRDDRFRGFELEAVARGGSGNYTRAFASYRAFEEKIRSPRFYLGRQNRSLAFGAAIARNSRIWRVFLNTRVAHNRVTFDPGYDYYTRIRIDGGANLFPESWLSCLLIGRYLLDWQGVSEFGGGARARLRVSNQLSAHVAGDVHNVPPTDLARFLKPGSFDIDGDSLAEYNHTGDRTLGTTTLETVSGAVRLEGERYSIAVTGRESRIERMVIWEGYEQSAASLYQPENRNADLRALSALVELTPPVGVEFRSGYTYARLRDEDDKSNLSLMPRHNLYASISWKQHIAKFRLDVFPSIAVEYHSINHVSHLNAGELDDYLLANGLLCVKIKSFTFYYSMENIFDTEYRTIYDYPRFRQVWWGFRWIFKN